MKPLLWFLFIAAAALAGTGCPATYHTTRKSELKTCEGKGPIRALTVDTVLYQFDTFSFDDSLLTGQGTLRRNGITGPFEGSIPFRRIVFIERPGVSYWKGVWSVPVMWGAALSMADVIQEPSKFKITRPVGGSCPYVYAYDGSGFRLESEAFGTSVSRAFEAESYSLLPSLVPVEGRLTVRISNERPETHFVNRVQLFAADAGPAAVLDVRNVLWPVPDPVRPAAARDHSGRDARGDVLEKDGQYWASDLAHTTPSSGFRDSLEVCFDDGPGASEATLVVHAINTDLITDVYRTVGGLLGDATLEFYQALEQDAELRAEIRQWVRECGLRVELRVGQDWKEVGMMPPEANVAPFSRALRIGNLGSNAGPLRLRLSSLAGVWRIDAVALDRSRVQPIPMRKLDMVSVRSSGRTDWENAVKADDSSYALLLPPDHLDIAFDAGPARLMEAPVYVCAVKGYLYEWFPAEQDAAYSRLSGGLTGRDRLALLELLIKQKDIFLPPIYAAWRRDHGEKTGR